MTTTLYPLQFIPILKSKIWGGQKLKTLLYKDCNALTIGESWEISGVENDISIVSKGSLKGKTLQQLINIYKADLIGEKNFKRFGYAFPLLIKFIDAKEALSIQLHPCDRLARKRHNSFGKTEMWYIIQADEDANIILGFNQELSLKQYTEHVHNNTLPEVLNTHIVTPGESFFVKAGQIHAIGAGVLLAEIQQTSDVTYRIYDWNRKDSQGNSRELHNHLVHGAIDFKTDNSSKLLYSKKRDDVNPLVSCPFFTTNYLHLTTTKNIENDKDSFIIYICIEGEVQISNNHHYQELVKKGETVLVPAYIKNYKLTTKNAILLEVYV